jgi:hypothetical protein
MHTYSTTEQVVGQWINGKPIYELTVENSSHSTTVDLSAYNIETVISLDTLGSDSNFSGGTPTANIRWTVAGVSNNNSRINYINASNQYKREGSFYTGAFVIQYTKTTDSASV